MERISNINRTNIRIQQKHDTTANWNKAEKTEDGGDKYFIPLEGELIVYDNKRLKIGDGQTSCPNLPFCTGVTVVQQSGNSNDITVDTATCLESFNLSEVSKDSSISISNTNTESSNTEGSSVTLTFNNWNDATIGFNHTSYITFLGEDSYIKIQLAFLDVAEDTNIYLRPHGCILHGTFPPPTETEAADNINKKQAGIGNTGWSLYDTVAGAADEPLAASSTLTTEDIEGKKVNTLTCSLFPSAPYKHPANIAYTGAAYTGGEFNLLRLSVVKVSETIIIVEPELMLALNKTNQSQEKVNT